MMPMHSESPRLLYVVHGYPPRNHAGTENYTHSFAREMAELGGTVGVFYPVVQSGITAPSLTSMPFENHTVFELKVPGKSLLNSLIRPTDPGIDQAFNEVLRRFRPDIVHFQHTFVNLPPSIILRSKEFGCTTCLTLHDFWYICPNVYMLQGNAFCGGPSPLSRCVDCLDNTLNLGIRNNKKAKDDLLQCLKIRFEYTNLIFSAVDLMSAPSKFLLDRFSNYLKLPQHARLPLGITYTYVEHVSKGNRPLNFGYLGNITSLKNVHGLVTAFKNVTGDAQLHIYGKALTDQELSRAISHLHRSDPRVIRHGSFLPEDLARILENVDVGVVPSFFENYPLVLREFLSARIPVIASRVGGIPEIVSHGRNGLLIDPWDPHELQRAMQAFVDKPGLIESMVKRMGQIKTMRQDAMVWQGIYNDLTKK